MPKNPVDFIAGKKPKGYKSPNLGSYEEGVHRGIGSRAGARAYTDDKGRTQYDYTNAFKPIQGRGGVRRATRGFDFSPMNEAIQGFRQPGRFSQVYRPRGMRQSYRGRNFNFRGLPSEYGRSAYQAQAKNLRREGAGQLEQLREAMGTRRPGMLMKAGENLDRQLGERLASADADIQRYVMDKGVDLGVQEQMAGADEAFKQYQSLADLESRRADQDYRAYESRANREARNMDQAFRYLQALYDAGRSKVGLESGLLEADRAYADKALDYLMRAYEGAVGTQNQAAQIDAQNRAATLGMIGSLGGAAASAFAPKK